MPGSFKDMPVAVEKLPFPEHLHKGGNEVSGKIYVFQANNPFISTPPAGYLFEK